MASQGDRALSRRISLSPIILECGRDAKNHTHVLNRGGRGVHSPLDPLQKAVSSDSPWRIAAKATHDGAFVWGDATNAEVFSTGVNTFTARFGRRHVLQP